MLLQMQTRINRAESNVARLHQICVNCAGSSFGAAACTDAFHCQVRQAFCSTCNRWIFSCLDLLETHPGATGIDGGYRRLIYASEKRFIAVEAV